MRKRAREAEGGAQTGRRPSPLPPPRENRSRRSGSRRPAWRGPPLASPRLASPPLPSPPCHVNYAYSSYKRSSLGTPAPRPILTHTYPHVHRPPATCRMWRPHLPPGRRALRGGGKDRSPLPWYPPPPPASSVASNYTLVPDTLILGLL